MNITGKIVDENSNGIAGLDVVAFRIVFQVEQREQKVTTDGSGNYSISVDPPALITGYYIRVYRGFLVELYESDSHTVVANADWSLPDIVIHSNYRSGWIVRDRVNGTAPMLSNDNKVEYHIDNERAWSVLSQAVQNASKSVHLQQYYLQAMKFIVDFGTNPDPLNPPAGHPFPNAIRLEKLLANASSSQHADVKVVIRDVTYLGTSITSAGFALLNLVPFYFNVEAVRALSKLDNVGDGFAVGMGVAFLFGPATGVLMGLALLIFPNISNFLSTAEIDETFFKPLLSSSLEYKRFQCDFFNPLHAKYTIIDNEALHITASPFMNGYYSSQKHLIKDFRYGNAIVRQPVHDVSGRLQGPILQDARNTYNKYWNKFGTTDTFSDPVVTAAQSGSDTASVQLTRTVEKTTFNDLPNGEKGILESYLRAINEATDYIYIENQYFTEEKIYNALVEKLKSSNDIQLICIVNLSMDIPGYDNTQRNRINALARALKGKESQFGFFSVWSQETDTANNHRQLLLNTYVHSKTAVIDDKWATFGSANLDGYSLRNQGGHEVNAVIYNGVDNLANSDLVASFRNKLWNEHLFSLDQDNTTTISKPSSGGWLSLWNQKAAEKLDSIKNAPGPPSASRVLAWVPETDPTDYLKKLQVTDFDNTKIKVLDKVPEVYDFKSGVWRKNSAGNAIRDFFRIDLFS